MGLNSALSIATGGLANINAQFQLISQNVANAATPGYAAEVGSASSPSPPTASGWACIPAPATLQIDQALQASVMQQNAAVSRPANHPDRPCRRSTACSGTPGSGNDLGSLLGNLQNSFSTLADRPRNQTQQSAVVSVGDNACAGHQHTSAPPTPHSARRAQNDLAPALNTLNSTLATIGELSNQIIALKPTIKAPPTWRISATRRCRRCRSCSTSRRSSNPTATCRSSPPAA